MTPTEFLKQMNVDLSDIHGNLREGRLQAMLVLAVHGEVDGKSAIDAAMGATTGDYYVRLLDALDTVRAHIAETLSVLATKAGEVEH